MTSTITSVYTVLDGMAVTYLDKDNTSVTATCYSLAESLDSVQTAHLPCRLLFLPSFTGSIGPGWMIDGQNTIRDLFLLEAVARTEGSKVCAPVLLRYVVAYRAALAQKWKDISPYWQAETFNNAVTIAPGKYEFPAGSDVWFYGVMVTLTVDEII
jgi:hypothetical protein